MDNEREPGNIKDRLVRILRREIRPHLNDVHPARCERYKMYEAIVVDLIRRPEGTEIEELWSQIEALSHCRPWGPAFRLSLRFRGQPKYPIRREPSQGQLSWDFSSPIEHGETADVAGQGRENHLCILRTLLQVAQPDEPPTIVLRRARLKFLMHLYCTLRGGA
ncbi:MAG: hypothetical protein R6U70_05705 [Bacillota bacterium]